MSMLKERILLSFTIIAISVQVEIAIYTYYYTFFFTPNYSYAIEDVKKVQS